MWFADGNPNHSTGKGGPAAMNIYYVYQYLRSKDSDIAPAGTPYYVGKGKNKRAWKKGLNEVQAPNDVSNIIIVAENLTESQAFELEKQLIIELGRIDLGTGILRNKTNGGEGPSGAIRSAEWRERQSRDRKGKKLHISEESSLRISESNKRKWSDPEYRARVLASRKNRNRDTISQEALKQISEKRSTIMKEKWKDPEYRRLQKKIRANYIDENFRLRMSEAKRNISDETREKMKEANKKKWQDPAFREKIAQSNRNKKK